MKIAIIGSRTVIVKNLGEYISKNDELVSGGAKGVDSCAAEYAKANGMKITEFLPEYEKYGRAAPIVRNKKIVDYADKVIAFWDGTSKGTKHVIDQCKRLGKGVTVHVIEKWTSDALRK